MPGPMAGRRHRAWNNHQSADDQGRPLVWEVLLRFFWPHRGTFHRNGEGNQGEIPTWECNYSDQCCQYSTFFDTKSFLRQPWNRSKVLCHLYRQYRGSKQFTLAPGGCQNPEEKGFDVENIDSGWGATAWADWSAD